MTHLMFDRRLVAQRRVRAARMSAPDTPTYLLDRTNDDLLERIAVVQRDLAIVGIVGAHTDSLSAKLAASARHGIILQVDQCHAATAPGVHAIIADDEAIPFATAAFDLIVSPLVLQHVNDLPGALVQMRRALKPDGLLLASLIGGESLTELRRAFAEAESEVDGGASARVAPFVDTRDLGGLLQRAGFALPVVDSDRFTVAYRHPLMLMHDLRAMGATNVLIDRRRAPLRRATLRRACSIYAERFGRADGKVLATFEILTATAWAPADSQPKPLKPGSATARLADVLGKR